MKINATIVQHLQGSDEWHQHRARSLNASELAAAMGVSKYMTRSKLIAQKATGLTPEIDAATQRLFDKGHEFEAIARPWAEEIIGDDLFPCVLAAEVDGLLLSASLDGQTMTGETTWEHKSGNADLLASLEVGVIPAQYHPQMEQGLMLANATRCLFMASSGDKDSMRFAWYESDPALRAKIIPTWKQFAADLAAYVPSIVEVAKPTGHAPDTLPALHIEVTGMVTASNLDAFKATALEAIRGVNRALSTDQHFADAEKAVKWCADVEERLAAAKAHALSQTASIDALFKTIDDISAEAKRVRLDLSKLVTTRKDELRAQVVSDAQKLLAAHVAALDQRIGKPLMHKIPADFAGAIKGKRSLDSINDAVAVELARAKIAANDVADRITVNLRAIEATGKPLLFADVATLVLKSADDLAAVIENRLAKAEADEAAREAAKAAIAQAQAPAPAAAPAAPVAAPRFATFSVMPPAPPAKPLADSDAVLRLGEINARLAPISISADGLTELGFSPVRQEKAAKLYREADYPAIVHAIVTRLSNSLLVQPA